ncbi:MAG: DUF2586 family protein [Gaiellales bacterium]
MALNDITINYGQGGLGRALDGEDYYSGMLFYTDNNPLNNSQNQAQILSLQQAEQLGIVGDYSDETPATITYSVDTAGVTGDTLKIVMTEPFKYVTIADISIPASITGDATAQANYIVNAINNGTRTHGYTAEVDNSINVIITFRAGMGVYPNVSSQNTYQTGTLDFIFVSTTNGVASEKAVWHYHIAEYFRLQTSGNLRVYFANKSGNAYDFAELGVMQGSATGKLRQVAIYLANTGNTIVNDISVIQSIQAQVDLLIALHLPMSTIVAFDGYSVSDLTTLVDLGAYDCRSVSVTIGQDGNNLGGSLTASCGFSMTDLGAVLGAVSLSAVNEDIAWVSKFNMTNGTELLYPAFLNTDLVDMVGQANLLTQLNNYRYLFLRQFVGVAGTFVNDNHCAISEANDYAYMNDNRVIDKAHRLLYAGVLPFLNGTIKLEADGTLSLSSCGYVQGLASSSLDAMVRNNEISNFEILIDPAQNILATSTLVITANIQPTGVARHITINLGFVTSI